MRLIDLQVCAKYTHGGNVKGTFLATFHSKFIERSWPQPPPFERNVNIPDSEVARGPDGCGLLRLSKENLLDLTQKIDTFDLKVIFTEEGTGTTDEVTWAGSLVDEPFRLEVVGNTNFIIGGLPYTAEISVTEHDGTPRTNELINICISLYRVNVKERKLLIDF